MNFAQAHNDYLDPDRHLNNPEPPHKHNPHPLWAVSVVMAERFPSGIELHHDLLLVHAKDEVKARVEGIARASSNHPSAQTTSAAATKIPKHCHCPPGYKPNGK